MIVICVVADGPLINKLTSTGELGEHDLSEAAVASLGILVSFTIPEYLPVSRATVLPYPSLGI